MTSKKFHQLFGAPPRKPETPIRQMDMDLAASIQVVTEEIMLNIAKFVHAETGMSNLCLAGGVALNCVGNGRVVREGPFEKIWIQPAAGDAGGALGVAQFIWHQLLDKPRETKAPDNQQASLMGPRFENDQIQAFLNDTGAKYQRFDDEEQLCQYVAQQLADQKVVGWMQNRMEFGPRALGSRSILGDPRSEEMQTLMNLKIKFRESFRPFAPSVLQEKANDYFELSPADESPYMLLVADVQSDKRETLSKEAEQLEGIERRKIKRSTVPAITHVDYSARVQTVDRERHGRYYKLIKEFEELTGCPMVINTSFNIRGEPIVCIPEDAYRCFMVTNMDVLVLEDFVLLKEEQEGATQHEIDQHLAAFDLD